MEPATQFGSLATPDIARDLADQVRRSIEAGARSSGGGRVDRGGNFFAPIVLTDIPARTGRARGDVRSRGVVFRAP